MSSTPNSVPLQEADLTSSKPPVAPSTKSSFVAPQRPSQLNEPIPSAAELLNDCVSTLSDMIDESLTTPMAPAKNINDISMSSISSSDYQVLQQQFNTSTTNNRRRRKSSLPIVVGDELDSLKPNQSSTKNVPRFARPTKSHIVRQASVKAERDLRNYRIKERERSERGTGKQGRWNRISTNKTMVGIPEPEDVSAYSTLNLTAANISVNTTTNISSSNANMTSTRSNSISNATTNKNIIEPITHHIRVASPVKGGPNLSISFEPAMTRWGTEWGLRGQPAVPTGDSNSSLGVDMSPRSSPKSSRPSTPRRLRTSSYTSSPLKPIENQEKNEELNNSSNSDNTKVMEEEIEKDIRTFKDPFLQRVTEDTESRMERTTKSWVNKQILMIASSREDRLTIQEEREISEAKEEKKRYALTQKKRKKVAKAAVKQAVKYQKEKEQNENETQAIDSIIKSLPELFQRRVMASILKNRQQTQNIQSTMVGTFSTKLKGKELIQKKLKKKKVPLPVRTDLFHEGGFNAHIERYKHSREQKEKELLQSTTGTWAPGHTIVKPFSFDKVSIFEFISSLYTFLIFSLILTLINNNNI